MEEKNIIYIGIGGTSLIILITIICVIKCCIKKSKKKSEINSNGIKNNEDLEKSLLDPNSNNYPPIEGVKKKKKKKKLKKSGLNNKIEEKEKEYYYKYNNKYKKEEDIIIDVDNNNNSEEEGPILIGLDNIGATCYMNATLQSLSNTDELTKYFLNNYKYEPNNNKKIMSNEYYKVIKGLWNKKNNKKSYSPNDFKEKLSEENPLFAGIAANDSKDLINFLLERLHTELNEIKDNNIPNNNNFNQNNQLNEQIMLKLFISEFEKKFNSIISNLFYGVLETKAQCQGCKMIKYNFQVYSFIEFPLEKVNQYCFVNGRRNFFNMNINKNPDINLYECFDYFGNFELMTGDNQMYCNICHASYDALYGSSLYTAPNNLIINLNRGRGAAYECKVIFPEQLDLSNYVGFKKSNTLFELYAVICHIGPSSMSGHFIAYCKNRMDKKWYKYNDSFVTLCKDPYEYTQGMAYILFYQVINYK